jgi:hypothetical protein
MRAIRPILTKVGTPQKPHRPSVWEALRILIALSVLEVINLTTHNDVLTVVAMGLIFGGFLAWYFASYWYSMGWISLPGRKRSY